MLVWKIEVLKELKKAGYTQRDLANHQDDNLRLQGQTLARLRKNEVSSTRTINIVCTLLEKQPGTLIKFVPDEN